MAFNGTVTQVTPVYKLQANDGGFINAAVFDLAFAATNYPLAGEPLLMADFDSNGNEIIGIRFLGVTDGAAVVIDALVDLENSKIILVDIADGLPLAADTDASGVTARVEVVYR